MRLPVDARVFPYGLTKQLGRSLKACARDFPFVHPALSIFSSWARLNSLGIPKLVTVHRFCLVEPRPGSNRINICNCLVQPIRVAILVWQCIAPDYRQQGILGLYVGGASCPDAGAIPYREWIFIA